MFIASSLRASDLNTSETMCTLSAEGVTRMVQVVYENEANPLPCKVMYTKDGVTKESGSAKNTRGHCEKIERDIVRDLIKGGYSCNHQFTGALESRQADVQLDLFEVPLATSATPQMPVDKIDLEDSRSEGQGIQATLVTEPNTPTSSNAQLSELLSTFEKDLQLLLNDRFADVLQELSSQATGLATSVSIDVEVSLHPIADQVSTVSTDAQLTTTLIDEEKQEKLAGAEVTSLEQEQPDAVALKNAEEPQNPGQIYALWSQGFTTEEDAHRFAAEFHRIYPYVVSRTIALGHESKHWRVAIGSGLDEQALRTRAAVIEQDISSQFEVTPVHSNFTDSSTVVIVQDDWKRYLVASCFGQGKTDSQSLQSCSGLSVDQEMFVSCLGGGVCLPPDASGDVVELVEYLTVLSSEDPMAEARSLLLYRVEGCSADAADSEFADCAARAVMTENQRSVLDCYEREQGGIGLLNCTNNERLSESVGLYERCVVDSYFASECILENVNNDYLNAASRCVHYGDQSEILTCALDSNLDIDQSRVLSCLKYSADKMQRAVCMADTHLDTDQAAIARCASTTNDISELGLCTLQNNGSLSQDELQAVECLAEGSGNPENLLGCVGGRLAAAELEQCQQNGAFSPAECFSDELMVASVATGKLENYLSDELYSSDIIDFRQSMFADQGGDIPYILSSVALTRFFADTVAVTKTAVEKTTSKTKNVWNKLGFGKKK